FSPVDPDKFSADLAAAINRLMGDKELCAKMAEAGRKRVEDKFSWTEIARETQELYQKVIDERG
ncbi:MAG: glycosyltransferase, partial [Verrucomicrobiota bacterium]